MGGNSDCQDKSRVVRVREINSHQVRWEGRNFEVTSTNSIELAKRRAEIG